MFDLATTGWSKQLVRSSCAICRARSAPLEKGAADMDFARLRAFIPSRGLRSGVLAQRAVDTAGGRRGTGRGGDESALTSQAELNRLRDPSCSGGVCGKRLQAGERALPGTGEFALNRPKL